MSDTPDENQNVVSMFGKRVASAPSEKSEPKKPDGVKLPDKVDARSIQTLNSVLEDVMNGKVSGVCVIATGPTGMGRFWLSYPKGKNAQQESTRYLGLCTIFKDILLKAVYNGIELDGDEDE